MDDTEFQKLRDQMMRDEEFRQRHYRNASGNLGARLGRSLQDGAVNLHPGAFERDMRRIEAQLEDRLPSFTGLNSVRQRVLIHMGFDLSVAGLLMLRRLIVAVESEFWETAAEEMLMSQWAQQDQRRATVLAEMMRTGRDLSDS